MSASERPSTLKTILFWLSLCQLAGAFLVALGLTWVGAFVEQLPVTQVEQDQVMVVVTTRDVPAGDRIEEMDLFLVELPKSLLHEGAFLRPLYVAGRVAREDLLANEIVRSERLVDRDVTEKGLQGACGDGDGVACSHLAEVHDLGLWGYPEDLRKAEALYEQACSFGNAGSCLTLGRIRHDGNPQQAVELYIRACSLGAARGCTRAGRGYEKGHGVAIDPAEAARYHTLGCDAGSAEACDALGLAVWRGSGVEQDRERAASLFERACVGGNVRGCGHFGDVLDRGDGVPEDKARAVPLFEVACKKGKWGERCARLSEMYARGEGVDVDPERASALKARACELGWKAACPIDSEEPSDSLEHLSSG